MSDHGRHRQHRRHRQQHVRDAQVVRLKSALGGVRGAPVFPGGAGYGQRISIPNRLIRPHTPSIPPSMPPAFPPPLPPPSLPPSLASPSHDDMEVDDEEGDNLYNKSDLSSLSD